MSSSVSLEYLNDSILQGNGFTSEGGVYHTYVNRGTNFTVYGYLACISTYGDNAITFYEDSIGRLLIGVMYNDLAPVGSNCKIVTEGKARIKVQDNSTAINRGDYLCATQQANLGWGSVYSVGTTKPSSNLVGIALENIPSGTNKTVLTQLMINP